MYQYMIYTWIELTFPIANLIGVAYQLFNLLKVWSVLMQFPIPWRIKRWILVECLGILVVEQWNIRNIPMISTWSTAAGVKNIIIGLPFHTRKYCSICAHSIQAWRCQWRYRHWVSRNCRSISREIIPMITGFSRPWNWTLITIHGWSCPGNRHVFHGSGTNRIAFLENPA